ncbi:hypothetical protein [Streptomyces sp. bgisy027]|uniref:hypothetical protein n=1 Tax=Streptomyces sp. bgisy027 TaxID=3413770 RepID=UPI003D763AA9
MVETPPTGGRRGEIEVRPVGRPPVELDDVPESRRELAELMRDRAFEPLKKRGFTQRKISVALGEGFSTASISRISSAKKLPTFAEVEALFRLAEEEAGQVLDAADRQQLELAHLRALEAEDSDLFRLFMAERACEAYQAECARRRAAEHSLKSELVQTHRLLHRADRTTVAARAQLARVEREKSRDAARLAQMRGLLAETETKLAVHVAALSEQAMRLRADVAAAQAERKAAERSVAAAQRRLADVEQRLLEEVASKEALAEELRVVRASRHHVLRERDELMQASEERRSEDSVLFAAEAAVRRAVAQLSEEELLVGAEKVGPAGSDPQPDPEDERQQELLEKALFGAETAVADLVADLADEDDKEAVAFVLTTAAGRPGGQVAALIQALGDAGYWLQREQLLLHAGQKPPQVVADLLQALERDDAITEMGLLFDAAAMADVPGLLNHLLQRDQHVQAVRLLDAAVRRRSMGDVAGLLALLAENGRLQEAESLLRDAVAHRSPRDVLVLLQSVAALPDGDRFTALSLEAAAERKPSAVVALCRALLMAADDAQAETMAAGILTRAAQAPIEAVVETASLLAGKSETSGLLTYLLAAFLEQRREDAWQLISHAMVQFSGSLDFLLAAIGGSAPADLLASVTIQAAAWMPLASETGENDAVTALLLSAGRRSSEDIATLLGALSGVDADLAHQLLGHTMRHSADKATDVIATLLRDGHEERTLLSYVSTGAPSLAAVLHVARALHGRRFHYAASHLLHHAGSRSRFNATEMTAALNHRLPGWAAQCLLAGAGTRSANLITELAVELYRQGRSPFVQLMLATLPTEPARTIDLASHLLGGDLRHDALWLLTQLAATASAAELSTALHLASPPVQDELIAQIVQHTSAAQYALLVTDLCAEGPGHLSLALVHAAADIPAASTLGLARALAGQGHEHQASWLLSKAERNTGTSSWPPAEVPQELAQALNHYAAQGPDARADDILLSTMYSNHGMPWEEVLPLTTGAVLKRTLLTVVEHLPRHLIVQASRPQVTAILRVLPAVPFAVRARLLQPPPDHQVAHLTNIVLAQADLPESSALAGEILTIAATAPEPRELLAVLRQVINEGAPKTAAQLMWAALRQRPLTDLPPVIRFAVSHHMSKGRTEIANMLKELHPQEHDAVNACLAEAFRPEFDLDIPRTGYASPTT